MPQANYGFRVLEHEQIPLNDGTLLSARVWLPDETFNTPVPAILEYLPYRKRGGTEERDEITHPHFAQHGYACVRVDIRGNGESDGLMHDEYTVEELSDGKEVIAWIAAQEWCDGKVGMIGISWGGFNGLQVAALRPPALKAVITICSTDDRYGDDIHFMGGCLLNDNLTWSAQMMNYSSRPPDPQLLGDDWRKIWRHRLETMPLLAANWLQHQQRDDFWKHGSVCEDYSAIEVPVLAVGGWHDTYTNAVPRILRGLKQGQAKALIGPWEHRYPHIAQVGPAIDFMSECVSWWDKWLKGKGNGVDALPTFRGFLMQNVRPNPKVGMREGFWVCEDSLPSANSSVLKLHLAEGKLLREPETAQGTTDAPIEILSPQDTGITTGNFCPGMRINDELPSDQQEDDAKSVVFDSEVLTEDLAILGAAEFEFEFACSAPQGMLVARLCEVAPDGASARVALNPLNLTHFASHETPQELEAGKVYRATIRLSDAGHIFKAGNRIRLALSTSYWPMLWPSPETATVTIQPQSASLTLPYYAFEKAQRTEFAPPPHYKFDAHEVLRVASETRNISVAKDGTVAQVFKDDMGHTQHRSSGLETDSRVTQGYYIKPDDPLSARAEAIWNFETRRKDWQVSTRSKSVMTCDAKNFYLSAELEAFENGESVFQRSWQETIPRDNV